MKLIKPLLLVLVIPITLITVLIGILSYADITLPLENVRQQFIKKASELTGSKVRIDGEVRLAISFLPTLVVNKLHIENKPGWSAEDILSAKEMRVQIALLPIFTGQLEFIDISASSIRINLEQAKDGTQNWQSFIAPKANNEEESSLSNRKKNHKKNFWIEEFRLTDLTLNYIDDDLGQEFTNHIDSFVINTLDKNRLTADIRGTSKNIPYFFTATSDLLRNIVSNKPWEMEMHGEVANKPLNLSIKINKIKPTLAGNIRINAKDVAIGKTFSWLRLSDDLDIYSNSIFFSAELTGNNLKNILEQSVFSLQLKEGYWKLHNPAGKGFKQITFSTAEIYSNKNLPVHLNFSGNMHGETIRMELSTKKLSDFFTRQKKIPLDISAKVASSTIDLKGDISLPISQKTFLFYIDIKGQKLDNWNKLFGRSIPPFGPYRLRGNISIDPQGFRIKNARMNIASSDLGGRIFINTSKGRTNWDLDLVSKTFQIRDFSTGDFTLFPGNFKKTEENDLKSNNASAFQPVNKDDSWKTTNLPNIRATLKLKARRVLSGKDDLGGGDLKMIVTNNSVSVERFNLNTPGGSINGALKLQKAGNEITGLLKLNMEKLDYGILYRYFEPDSPYDGLISTQINLKLAGKDIRHLLDHGNGVIDFAIWPEDMGASVINVWSVNLFLALLPELKKKQSKFNCTTALLDVKDGQLTEELLFIDTSKIWMKGNVNINFPEEKLAITLFPTAKKAKLFGLQVPIRLKGTFADIGVSVKPFDLVTAYASFITSPLHAPFRRAFSKKTGENLSKLCGQLLDRKFLKAMLEKMKKNTPTIDEMYE